MTWIVFINPAEDNKSASVACYEPEDDEGNCRSEPPCGGCQSCMQRQHAHWGGIIGYTDGELPLNRVKGMVKQCTLLHKNGSENAGCRCVSPKECNLKIWPRDESRFRSKKT